MQRKLLYLINPISGTGDKRKLFEEISRQTSASKFPFEVTATNASGNYNNLRKRIRDEKFTDVVICGGDGSISKVTAALDKMDVQFGIVPMGSGNGLAFAAGISKDLSKALQVVFNGQADWIDGFYLNNTFCCMLCGLGFDAQVAHDFAKQPTRGLATYAKQTIGNFFDAKPYAFSVEINGESFTTSAYFISVANSNQFGNYVTIAPRASLNDGLLDVVIAEKMHKAKLLLSVGRQIIYGKVDRAMHSVQGSEKVKYYQASKLKIINHQAAPLHIDGDPADTVEEINIAVYPRAFRLIQPVR